MFPWADPRTWWGHRTWTSNDTPGTTPTLPCRCPPQLSRVICSARADGSIIERRVRAHRSTSLRFGNILHPVRPGDRCRRSRSRRAADREVLDGVWARGRVRAGGGRHATNVNRRNRRPSDCSHGCATPRGVRGSRGCHSTPRLVLPPARHCERWARSTARPGRGRVGDHRLQDRQAIDGAEVASHVQLGLYRWSLNSVGSQGQAVALLLFPRKDPPRSQPEDGAKVMRQETPDNASSGSAPSWNPWRRASVPNSVVASRQRMPDMCRGQFVSGRSAGAEVRPMNREQRPACWDSPERRAVAAISAPFDGPMLVLAGAGSGKTR